MRPGQGVNSVNVGLLKKKIRVVSLTPGLGFSKWLLSPLPDPSTESETPPSLSPPVSIQTFTLACPQRPSRTHQQPRCDTVTTAVPYVPVLYPLIRGQPFPPLFLPSALAQRLPMQHSSPSKPPSELC